MLTAALFGLALTTTSRGEACTQAFDHLSVYGFCTGTTLGEQHLDRPVGACVRRLTRDRRT